MNFGKNMNTSCLLSLRKKIIEKDFSNLNSMQLKAVTSVNGPLLILAGAGSGKTTVIVNRIACLIKYGSAYTSEEIYTGFSENAEELLQRYLHGDASVFNDIQPMLSVDAPKPWQILAITFTNKAANELKERLVHMLGEDGGNIWASTFHSACVRILRREAAAAGYSEHFTIYDTDDSKRVIKECQRILNIDDKHLSQKTILNEISKAKDELITPEEYAEKASREASFYDRKKTDIAKVYAMYQDMLQKADAMDFDDIIVNTVRLLQNNPDVLSYYQKRFRYVMVDEYQDTNHAQYVLVSLLSGGYDNLCVVGDDDQSIYSFRGATIENILSFEEQFSDCTVIKLEENYRSTQNILDAANAVISHNTERKGKNLFTSNGAGDKITLRTCPDDINEAKFVADTVMDYSVEGGSFSDVAVLYRMNAQSNNIERALVTSGIPYKIIGGHRFYDRKEIKDAIAYLAVVSNHNDNVRLRRIVNEPKRGIGETTLNNVSEIASRTGESMFEVMKHADEYSVLSRGSAKLKLFTEMIESFTNAPCASIPERFRLIMNESGYIQGLAADPDTKQDRIENLNELYSTIARYEEEMGEEASLEGYLEDVALLSDIDNYEEGLESVTLMTLHSAKGLEFPVVFLVGMENNIFPSAQSQYDPGLLQEERRLAYVGITRAKKKLYITNAYSRMQFGKTQMNPPSVFIKEIPDELMDDISPLRKSGTAFGDGFFGNFNAYKQQKQSVSFEHSHDSYGYSGNVSQTYSTSLNEPAIKKLSVGTVKKSEAAAPAFCNGDTVLHRKFGKGLIVSVTPLGNDQLLEVAFESCGTKKLMANMAKLEKV